MIGYDRSRDLFDWRCECGIERVWLECLKSLVGVLMLEVHDEELLRVMLLTTRLKVTICNRKASSLSAGPQLGDSVRLGGWNATSC